MKIIITGSLGNVSKPLTIDLLQKGHDVTVISSNADKKKDIEKLGAKAAIGSMEDVAFLSRTFAGADAVYCMIPLSFTEPHVISYMQRIALNYMQALTKAGTRRVVVLSGWAADLIAGENLESVFAGLTDTHVTYLRPASFYSNFYDSMELIRGSGWIGKLLTLRYSGPWALLTGRTGLLMGNCGGDDRMVFVSPEDIAAAAAEELLSTRPIHPVRYIGSEEMTCNEAAKIIGTAIGKPWLKWVLISDKQMLQGLRSFGMQEELASLLVDMQSVNHSGAPLKNFHDSNPVMGKVRLRDFAKQFATVYHQK